MDRNTSEVQQRLSFINRTIGHATRACKDGSVPGEVKTFVELLGRKSSDAQQALHADATQIRRRIDDLAWASDQAQRRIRPDDAVCYAVKSAVILTHIEVSALKNQLD